MVVGRAALLLYANQVISILSIPNDLVEATVSCEQIVHQLFNYGICASNDAKVVK